MVRLLVVLLIVVDLVRRPFKGLVGNDPAPEYSSLDIRDGLGLDRAPGSGGA